VLELPPTTDVYRDTDRGTPSDTRQLMTISELRLT